MRNAFRRAGLYSSLVASLLLVITALTMNTPASADSESDSAGPAPGERNFTIPGPEIKRSEILIDGSTGETAQTTTDNSRLQGEITDDGEDAFDAMVAVFEEKYPRTISFGGMSLDGSGIRWLLIPDAPTADQVEIFKTYGLPLRIKYGNAPTPDEMRALAGTMRLVSLAGGPITFQGYGFNADHTGLEVRYSASSDLSQADLEAKARDLVVNGLKQLGRELTFDVDFIETPGPMLDVTADITGGYGLTNSSSTAVCTSGFTAT